MGNEIKDVEGRLRKRRTIIIVGLAGAVISIVALGMVWNFYSFFKIASKKNQQEVITEEPKVRFEEEDWKSVMEVRIKKLEDKLNEVEDKFLSIERFMERIDRKLDERQFKADNTRIPELPPPKIKIQKETNKEQELFLPKPPGVSGAPVVLDKRPASLTPSTGKLQKKQPEILREFKPERKEQDKSSKKSDKKNAIVLPAGFTKAILLSGLDAPTLQYGRNNPHPVLALLMDRTILANNKHLNLKGCMVLGSAYGELSSERAYIRVTKISCIDKNNKVYTQNVKGWIFGSDGKPGIRGRLVTRFGSVLAKTFIAGTLEGISRILQATNTTVAISPIGATTTINPEDATRVAVASGFGEAARRLADFYIKLANEYFPVIEIPAGKAVTVVFEGGDKLEEYAEVSNPEPLNYPERSGSKASVSEGGEDSAGK